MYYTRLFKEKVISDSIYIILANLVNFSFGFVFWVVAGRLYPESDVGLSSSILALIMLFVTISNLGLNDSLIKYHSKENDAILGTTIIVPILFSIGIWFIFQISYVDNITNQNNLKNSIVIILLIIFNVIYIFIFFALIVKRKTKSTIILNIANGTRILFLFGFTSLGFLGILNSALLGIIIASIIGYYMIKTISSFQKLLNIEYLIKSIRYSMGNYISSIFQTLPLTILPMLVLVMLSPESAAYYFICFNFYQLFTIVPKSISISLFVEGIRNKNYNNIISRITFFSILLLIPGLIITIFWGEWILSIFGPAYSINGYELLVLFSISSILYVPIAILTAIGKTESYITFLILINVIYSITLLSLSFVFIQYYGLIGMGYAYLFGLLLTTIIIYLYYIHIKNK